MKLLSCDFVEQFWNGESTFAVKLINWETEPQTLAEGQEIGHIKLVTVAGTDDPIWTDSEENGAVRAYQIEVLEGRKEELKKRLKIATSYAE